MRIFSKPSKVPNFEILWGGWTHFELKSWFDRPTGTFILHGGPLRPVVKKLASLEAKLFTLELEVKAVF